jgi:hypothetical protein
LGQVSSANIGPSPFTWEAKEMEFWTQLAIAHAKLVWGTWLRQIIGPLYLELEGDKSREDKNNNNDNKKA